MQTGEFRRSISIDLRVPGSNKSSGTELDDLTVDELNVQKGLVGQW